jgi:hypothetical protein
VTNGQLAPATKPEELTIEQIRQQLQRILHSNTLRNSLTLQQLLQFLGTRAIDGNSEVLKEYTIGVEAFGRKPDFDPKTDTIVRVQTHRLRQKIKEYYQDEGVHDLIFLNIRNSMVTTSAQRAIRGRTQMAPLLLIMNPWTRSWSMTRPVVTPDDTLHGRSSWP